MCRVPLRRNRSFYDDLRAFGLATVAPGFRPEREQERLDAPGAAPEAFSARSCRLSPDMFLAPNPVRDGPPLVGTSFSPSMPSNAVSRDCGLAVPSAQTLSPTRPGHRICALENVMRLLEALQEIVRDGFLREPAIPHCRSPSDPPSLRRGRRGRHQKGPRAH